MLCKTLSGCLNVQYMLCLWYSIYLTCPTIPPSAWGVTVYIWQEDECLEHLYKLEVTNRLVLDIDVGTMYDSWDGSQGHDGYIVYYCHKQILVQTQIG